MDFQVNYAALDAAAADINTGAANLQNCLDDLEQTLNQLRSSWEGQTQEAYDIAQRQWNQGLEGLKDVLRLPRRCLGSLQLPADGPVQRFPLLRT